MDFDFANILQTEFGVGTRTPNNPAFYHVPVHQVVEANVRQMVATTWEGMLEIADDPAPYEPSNLPAGRHHLSLGIHDPLSELFSDLNDVDNFPAGGDVLQEPRNVFCYFVRLTDAQGRRLLAMRRSSSFKGLLNLRGRLLRWADDALQVTEDNQFRLDYDFDLLVDANEVRVLYPAGLESIAQLQGAIKDAVPVNVATLSQSIPYVEFGPIQDFAANNIRAARMLSSIRNQGADGITLDSLQRTCADNRVVVHADNGRLRVHDDQILGFLETLDRRRFRSSLAPQQDEVFVAYGRKRI